MRFVQLSMQPKIYCCSPTTIIFVIFRSTHEHTRRCSIRDFVPKQQLYFVLTTMAFQAAIGPGYPNLLDLPGGTYIFHYCSDSKMQVRHHMAEFGQQAESIIGATLRIMAVNCVVPYVEWLQRSRATCRPRCTVLHPITRHNGTGLCGFPRSTI
jgi:hypothetical protein